MDDHRDPQDARLLEALEEVLLLTQDPPQHVLEAAYAAFDWPSVDAELAEMVAEQTATAVRGPASALSLRFRLEDFELELEVSVQADSQRIAGWLEPPAETPLEVHHAGGTVTALADADGRFAIEGLRRGPARLICRPAHRGAVEVRWSSP